MTADNLILALDVETPAEALQWVARLKGRVGCFKVGLQLFCKAGPAFVREIRQQGVNVFLDLKLCDIPNTVAKAIGSVAELDVRFLTVHTLGGAQMLREALAVCPPQTTLLGVTVLTSMDDDDLRLLGFDRTVGGEVMQLARVAEEAGLKALVCSSLETELLRREFGDHFTLITPGVRPMGTSLDDQSRVTTPQQALDNGSNYVVMGRPILKAENPEALLDSLFAA
ncbi:MAG: orotidine-5'-phosphate decarboxylase [bacterium]